MISIRYSMHWPICGLLAISAFARSAVGQNTTPAAPAAPAPAYKILDASNHEITAASPLVMNTGDTVSLKLQKSDGTTPADSDLAGFTFTSTPTPAGTSTAVLQATPSNAAPTISKAAISIKASAYGMTDIQVFNSKGVKVTDSVLVEIKPILTVVNPGPLIIGRDTNLVVLVDGTAALANTLTFSSSNANALHVDKNTGVLTALTSDQASVNVLFSASDKTTATASYAVNVATLSGIGQIVVDARAMDDSTVGELFGRNTARGFFVVNLNIFNKTDATKKQSITVYADTLEAHVVLEKRYDGSSQRTADVNPPAGSGWTAVTEEDYQSTFARLGTSTLPPTVLRDVNVVPAHLVLMLHKTGKFNIFDQNRKPIENASFKPSNLEVATVVNGEVTGNSVGTTTVQIVTSDNKTVDAYVTVLDSDPTAIHEFIYKPYSYDVVVDSSFIRFDRQNQMSPFNIAAAAGTIVSFFTAANVLRGDTATLISDKYSNLLLPGLEKLFPSHLSDYSSNIAKHVMKQVEEVPWGTSITRLLFFPKRQFKGLIRGYYTRISGISPDFAKMDVGFISDKSSVTTTPAAGTNTTTKAN